MENKYVSFRIEDIQNTTKLQKIINHDYRQGYIPKYVKSEKSHNNYNLWGHNFDIKKIEELQNSRSKRKIQKNTSRFFMGIVTFSETMSQDFYNNRKKFDECSKDYIENLQKKLNVKILSAIVHLDEKTPHIHLIFDNIDNNGKSIKRNITPQICSDLQDLGGNCYEKMGYQRGEKGSSKIHLNVNQLHMLESVKNDLQSKIQEKEEMVKAYNKYMLKKPLTQQEEAYIQRILTQQQKNTQKQQSNTLLQKAQSFKCV